MGKVKPLKDDESILTNNALSAPKESGAFYNKDSFVSNVDRLESQSDKTSNSDVAKGLGSQALSIGGKEIAKEGFKQLGTLGAKEAGKEIVKEGITQGTTSQLGSLALGAGGVASIALGAKSFYDQYHSLDGAAGKLAFDKKQGALQGGIAGAGIAGGGIALGAAMGATYGSVIPVVGTAIGAVLGAAAGMYMNKLKSGKGTDQLKRDLVRESLVDTKFLDKEGKYTLSDGTIFEMGLDGGFKYADGFHAYEVDHKDPLQSTVFGHALPIAEMMAGSDDKLTSDFAGYLTRMALSGGATDANGALVNLKDAAIKLGIDSEKVAKYTTEMVAGGAITEQEAAAYIGGIGNVFNDKRNVGAVPNDAAKESQKANVTGTSIANKVNRQKPKDRRKQTQEAVSNLGKQAQTALESSKAMSDAWGANYLAAQSQTRVA